jgi:hypothetical protein
MMFLRLLCCKGEERILRHTVGAIYTTVLTRNRNWLILVPHPDAAEGRRRVRHCRGRSARSRPRRRGCSSGVSAVATTVASAKESASSPSTYVGVTGAAPSCGGKKRSATSRMIRVCTMLIPAPKGCAACAQHAAALPASQCKEAIEPRHNAGEGGRVRRGGVGWARHRS